MDQNTIRLMALAETLLRAERHMDRVPTWMKYRTLDEMEILLKEMRAKAGITTGIQVRQCGPSSSAPATQT